LGLGGGGGARGKGRLGGGEEINSWEGGFLF